MYLERVWEFAASLSPLEWLFWFWPFFFVDLVRYTLSDVLVFFWYLPRRASGTRGIAGARRRLYEERPLVSVIAPGKNEGRHIPKLCRSLRAQTYARLETIIVDDGSDDNTEEICRDMERRGEIDLFIRNDVRGGKASAANTALNFCRGTFIVHLDADSNLRYDSIERVLLPFYMDENVGAVGGDIRVHNVESSLASSLQGIEYLKSITVGRTVTSALGILRIISGAYGAFDRRILERLGGWDVGPGLDGDITVKIRKLGFRVVHEPEAVCFTNVPTMFRKLARQRYRWDRSMVRFRMRKHRDILMPGAGFSLLNFVSSFENILFNVVLNLKWWFYLVQMVVWHADMLVLLLPLNYMLYLGASTVQFLVALVAFRSTLRSKDVKLALFLPVMPLYMGVFLRLVRTFALIMEAAYRVSYRDAWNPWKVSSVARREGL